MVSLISKRFNRKWIYAALLFSLGVIAPYCLRGFFQNLSAQDQLVSALPQKDYPAKLKEQFAHAVKLTNAKEYDKAIEAYQSLIQTFPNYPEPYNNLAVIYAAQNQLDLAEIELEKAMKTSGAYEAVYRNLTGIYMKWSSDAYRLALTPDVPKADAPVELTQIASLSGPPSTVASSQSVPQKSQDKPTESTVALLTVPQSTHKPETPTIPSPAEVSPVQQEAISTAVAATPIISNASTSSTQPQLPIATAEPQKVETVNIKPSEPTKPEKAKRDKKSVVDAVQRWAQAWSKRDTKGYIAAYSNDFKLPNGQTRSQWEKTRKQRIIEKESIKVVLSNIVVDFTDDDHAKVRFSQRYEAGALKATTRKTLIMKRVGNGWKIQEERIG